MTRYQEQLDALRELANQQPGDKEAARIIEEWKDEQHAQRIGGEIVPIIVHLGSGKVDYMHNVVSDRENGHSSSK